MKIFKIVSFAILIFQILGQISNNSNITNKTKSDEKPFNLTEALVNFFTETFGTKDVGSKNDSKNENEKEDGNQKKINEQKMKKLEEEKEKKRKEENEKLEKIKIENEKKEEIKKKYEEERLTFIISLANNTFGENILLNLEKGEKETLYMNLERFQKIKLAIMIEDEDQQEKINFSFSGPNQRGYLTVLRQFNNKNYLFLEYEAIVSGEYYAEITNKGTKRNEIYCLINENVDKKKDVLNSEKLDKISTLLNDIDVSINQVRAKKRIEIKQINLHNNKITRNNRWIVIYSIIEIFTMIIIFLIQSCYINSLVNKI